MPIVTPALVLSLLALSPTIAPATEPQADEIVVTAISKPLTLNSKELARALKAHLKLRAVYAPQSQLSFQLVAAPGATGAFSTT